MGLEPTTSRATIWRPNQLGHIHHVILERVKGIEPSHLAWEASALPLSYTRNNKTFAADPNLLPHSQHFLC